MEIGPQKPARIIRPLEEPVPARRERTRPAHKPTKAPARTPEKTPVPEKAPVKV